MRNTLLCAGAALALLALPAAAEECEYLTEHFELCSSGTPWATGRWENGGDSATLYLGKIGFEGYEDFVGNEKGGGRGAALDRLLAYMADDRTHTKHTRDRLQTKRLKIARSIETTAYKSEPPEIWVLMIADGGGHRIELSVTAPADTPLAQIDQMSRDYAALVRPRKLEKQADG